MRTGSKCSPQLRPMDFPIKIDQAALLKALTERGASPSCSACGKNNWAVVPDSLVLPVATNLIPAPGIPVATLLCNNCGNARSHSLVVLGLLPTDAPSKV